MLDVKEKTEEKESADPIVSEDAVQEIAVCGGEAQAEPPKKPISPTHAIAICAVLAVACVALLFVNRATIAAGVKALFDTRPDLTELSMFEAVAEGEVESITVTVQSTEYQAYTEQKIIEDAAEIAQLLASISAAKLVVTGEDGADTTPSEITAEDDEDDTGTVIQYTPPNTSEMDVYRITLAGQSITFYTKANEGTYLYIEGDWLEIDFKGASDFYAWYLSCTEDAIIYDTNGLVFYPQEWVVGETELDTPSYGIDVSYHQGVIDWEQVAADGVEFAMIRVGVRYAESGILAEDPMARYNLQEATKYGIAVGVYFFSTAATEEEVLEEVALTLDVISGYAITYPVVYDCEMFHNADNRNSVLSIAERSAFADLFLSAIEAEGYTGMFYASKNDLEANASWETNYLQSKYRIWVAQYPGDENEAEPEGASTYSGRHEMWQYTSSGTVAGIEGSVDRNVAYFSYSELAEPLGTPAEEISLDDGDDEDDVDDASDQDSVADGTANNNTSTEAGDDYDDEDGDGFETVFYTVDEQVTAKEITNLRNMPSVTDEESVVMAVLTNGEVITRTGVSDEGFSRVEYQGQTLYCVSSYLEIVE